MSCCHNYYSHTIQTAGNVACSNRVTTGKVSKNIPGVLSAMKVGAVDALTPHLDGWLCVHAVHGQGNANTGNQHCLSGVPSITSRQHSSEPATVIQSSNTHPNQYLGTDIL